MSDTPVIFNVAYTPYKLKKGSTETEIKAHAGKRSFHRELLKLNFRIALSNDEQKTHEDFP